MISIFKRHFNIEIDVFKVKLILCLKSVILFKEGIVLIVTTIKKPIVAVSNCTLLDASTKKNKKNNIKIIKKNSIQTLGNIS